VTRHLFRESASIWLKENSFSDEEIEKLQNILNNLAKTKKLVIPKGTDMKVSAMAYLLDSVLDEDGGPVCFEEEGLIGIPREARTQFVDALEIEEFEGTISRLKRIKEGRTHSAPKRRGSTKDEKY